MIYGKLKKNKLKKKIKDKHIKEAITQQFQTYPHQQLFHIGLVFFFNFNFYFFVLFLLVYVTKIKTIGPSLDCSTHNVLVKLLDLSNIGVWFCKVLWSTFLFKRSVLNHHLNSYHIKKVKLLISS
jgi:hypothetical protein